MHKQKIIITGNLGFICSHITDYFISKGYYVYGIDNHSVGSHPELITSWEKTGQYTHTRIDVSDEKIIDLVVKINPTFIIHGAAVSDVDESIRHPMFVIKQNTLGNLYMMEAARKCSFLKKYLFLCTDEIFGECELRKKEDDLMFPTKPYAASKATGAIFRYAYDISFPQLVNKTVETRFCNIFGPRQDSRKVIPRIIESIKTGKPVSVHNEGLGRREYLHIDNIPPLMEKVLMKGSRTYNITANESFTVNELIKYIEHLTDKKVPTIRGHRPGMDHNYSMDSTRFKEEFDWKPIVSFKKGLKELLIEENICKK